MHQLIFAVTNDLSYDQRMMRICTSLANAGYGVMLVGVKRKDSKPLLALPFRQKRLHVFFKKGPLFYVEYNLRLFWFLLFQKADCMCAIDLDTIIPVHLVATMRSRKKVYDAHEYFSQLKEVVSRAGVYQFWHSVERILVPRFKAGYTVCKSIADEFHKLYGVSYETIRNLPLAQHTAGPPATSRIILYQGAVNEARGFEYLVPAMKEVDAQLVIFGDGNFLQQAMAMVNTYQLTDKIIFKGKFLPGELNEQTGNAYIGINLVEHTGLNQYYSLANKFFDYIQHAVPQVTMNFPEYKTINDQYGVALLLDDLQPASISSALNKLLNDEGLHAKMKEHCILAAKELTWQNEEKKLLHFYRQLFE